MKIKKCRSCNSKSINTCLNLGNQSLTGIFPKKKYSKITKGPLALSFCDNCKLLQLSNNYDHNEMYGLNYGYMSSLNSSMKEHLYNKSIILKKKINIKAGDTVIDIGSNDGTFLSNFDKKFKLIGVDPTILKFSKFYRKDIKKIPHFFSHDQIKNYINKNKVRLITSIAMFYDLEKPINFVEDVYETLSDDGIWHFEQSYMPSMIKNLSYDTICHEHLEYYSLKSVKFILDKVGFKIIDLEINNINGGSFALTVAKKKSMYNESTKLINWLLSKEEIFKFNNINTIKLFANNVVKQKIQLKNLIDNLLDMKKILFGYGASTKGNVILQYCNITNKHIPYIVDVNPFKENHYTPGTNIKIISEKKFKKLKCDYLLVLPWHFREFIINKEKNFLNNNGHLIFPLPDIEII